MAVAAARTGDTFPPPQQGSPSLEALQQLAADGGRLAASRPLLQPAGGGKTNVLAAAGGAAGVGGAAVRPRQASIILSETELPNLAEWGL